MSVIAPSGMRVVLLLSGVERKDNFASLVKSIVDNRQKDN
ncbi:hypothetical protein CSE45_1012 [Citreicella sp. SE45]|nr:hypothetical protein CSE45_1012 [Citreicella sp. SE45]